LVASSAGNCWSGIQFHVGNTAPHWLMVQDYNLSFTLQSSLFFRIFLPTNGWINNIICDESDFFFCLHPNLVKTRSDSYCVL
jgi:hypothetical protein